MFGDPKSDGSWAGAPSALTQGRLWIHDSEGFVIAASSQQIAATYTTQVVKAIAIYMGVKLDCETGLVPMDVESDAAILVGWITDSANYESEVGLVIEAIRLLMQGLSSCNLKFVSRKAIYVVHNLAKLALCNHEDQFWLENYPSCVRKYLPDDFATCVRNS
ncbi:hypothetical protein Dsin_016541 [Dipteronia sinensis]|uniref:RNase H type-1 domain-containing protein n=1 Tax=Dipteronia sinensis TaxID=43782 RepID=A0AAE0E636_9ROSI|nr:hypothetical protein Dsin_016541 [Dipteronia sinensis]